MKTLKDKTRVHEYFIKGDETYFSEKDVKEAVLEFEIRLNSELDLNRTQVEHLDKLIIEIFGDFEK